MNCLEEVGFGLTVFPRNKNNSILGRLLLPLLPGRGRRQSSPNRVCRLCPSVKLLPGQEGVVPRNEGHHPEDPQVL